MRTRGLIRVRRAELTEDDDLDAEREGEAGAEDRDAAAKWARSAGALSRSGSSGVPHANVLPNRRGVLRARHSRVSCVRVGLGLAWVAHLIMTSLEHFSHMLCRMMAGRAVAQSCVKRGGLGGWGGWRVRVYQCTHRCVRSHLLVHDAGDASFKAGVELHLVR